MRYGENDMKISGRQKLVLLLNDPHLLVQALALWTVPVAARIIADAQVTTLITSINVAAQSCGAASVDGRKRPPVMRRKPTGG